MKKVLLITSITLITLSHRSQAQTYSGTYKKEVTEHFKDEQRTSQTTKFKAGVFILTDHTVQIDNVSYTILKRDAPEIQDENYWCVSMVVVTQSKTGKYNVMDCIVELKPDKKTVDYVQLNKTKSTKVGYELVNN